MTPGNHHHELLADDAGDASSFRYAAACEIVVPEGQREIHE